MYSRTPYTFLLNDSPVRIDYHVLHDDYFTHLATLMGFLEEAIANDTGLPDRIRQLPRELRRDLRYVQANYTITPRALVDIQRIPGKGNLIKR